jgi:hypothetical protein
MTQARKKGDGDAAVETAIKPAGEIAANSAAQAAANAGGWPVDDITGLARRLPEIDPASYFDAQAMESYRQSLTRWPVLARLMKLVPSDATNAADGSD